MENTRRIELIEKALVLINVAKSLVDAAVEKTSIESHYIAYNCYGFNSLKGCGSPYDTSINSLIEVFGKEGRE